MNGATTIKVRYFAQVAELTQVREEDWPLPQAISGTQWLAALAQRYPQLGSVSRLKLAINQFHVAQDTVIQPGDEVAVFEPVTGG
ncbi:MoaD/ThiS family protein [Pollutimonas thiosulfatoxidans]|uniref:Molybdopterin synthase sulfur carrier subunit n=1 Tax=Pollutimonas thiosulfatoxidans TaxID=2028345 RepID=A0A410G892_9BURK|nr:MoaD/ThiS family protein [Pollutimonas thiosulfatoxidans]MBF6615386.1 MoaD/ThiS family protein [Candidimonas sp.]NYT43724.1 MoaD/ThiS family protein [Alcaligenaceae bacterium]QAA92532.1 molybdopterin synthase sulfur carrier subunit [Pollutimonas thiosulfatoxidans]